MKKMSLALALLTFSILGWSCANPKEKKKEETKTEDTSAMMTDHQASAAGNAVQASFKNMKGETVALSDLKGKVVVMNFWATWCPPCIRELPSLNQLHQEFANQQDIVFMAIEVDQDIQKAADFLAKNKYDLPLYTLDSDLPRELATESIPVTVVLAKNGDIVAKHVGMMDFGSPKLKENLIELTKENNR